MILGFKEYFKDGTPTNFESKILRGEKIHSMREGRRWRPGNSIQMAYGVRTKQYRQFNADCQELQFCISVQKVFMTLSHALEVSVDNNYLSTLQIISLIQNDGLTREQFLNWFFPGNKDEWSGQIIHWTDFKYER